MARIPLSKSQLTREKDNMASYRRYLPALDLKRQQLMGERNRERARLAEVEARLAAMAGEVGDAVPMLGDRRVNLDGLVKLGAVKLGSQNVAGVRLPVVEDVEVLRASYGWMVRPHWVDTAADRLAEAIRLRVEARVLERRVKLLDAAVVTITQRTNLFDKVLIPQAAENIRRIMVYLGDAERAAVVGAKLAKGKSAARATT
jgi:V/A-type H+-transporting ATPase subunit D